MASSLYNLALDFSKELNYTKAIMARQGDKGITVTVKPFLNGLQMDTSGGTFTLKGTTPSNRYVDSVATSITSEEVTFSLDGTFMSEAGYYKHCYVEYRKDNQILTTQDIIFFSLGVSDISQGQADEYVSQLEELIRKYNETFDTFMAEIKGRVDSLNKQITDLTGQAKTLQDKLDALKEEISKLGNLQVTYSNSIDFGGYDYSGNPNLMRKLSFEDWDLMGEGITKADANGEYVSFDFSGEVTDMNMYAGFSHKLPLLKANQKYTLTAEVSTDVSWEGRIRMSYRINKPDGSPAPSAVGALIGDVTNPQAGVWYELTTMENNHTIPDLVKNYKSVWLQINLSNRSFKGKLNVRYNIKIEEGETSTPYQPNLLDAPYYLSKKTLGKNLLDPTGITSSSYLLLTKTPSEKLLKDQTYTITLKGTKPATQTFRCFVQYETNGSTVNLLDMKPVEGLVDEWQLTFKATRSASDITGRLYVYQVPNTSLGQCKVEWIKLEKGDTRTPNIEQYKYRGIGMRDSNNPKDYVWDLAPEYVEAEVTKKVAQVNSQLKEHVNDTNNPHEVTKNQVGLGNVDNFSTATQTEAEKGEASNKFMTPQRTTQMITKRIATDAEVVAGTDLNKLVTPKSLDIYYRDRTQVAVASYGTEDIALTAKEELSEASWRYRRIGDIVEFYGRFKLKEATDIVNVHELPTGFRLSTDFDDTSWNVPLNIQKAANPTSYVAGAFVERQGTNLLRVGGNSSGNHYVSGWWYTDDPFPTG
ncbi:TPA: BppU family phage baseplate upper protein [Enterococcus faecium]